MTETVSIIRSFDHSSFVIRHLSFVIISGFLLLAIRPCHALTIELTHHDAPRPGQWELLTVTLHPHKYTVTHPESTIEIRDARGGLAVSRPISAATRMPDGKLQLLIPLPYLAETDLPAGRWPIDVHAPTPIDVVRPAPRSPISTLTPAEQWPKQEWNLAPASASSLRIIVPANTNYSIPTHLYGLPFTSTAVPDHEILSGPVLLFASTDMLLLSPELASKMSQDRAAALMA
ncbi:MAG: hypothetical protein FWD53_07215, partial [Phycisphaerales bacterium]|nr:hypothetical protein [Phycisphaerales bacterium]